MKRSRQANHESLQTWSRSMKMPLPHSSLTPAKHSLSTGGQQANVGPFEATTQLHLPQGTKFCPSRLLNGQLSTLPAAEFNDSSSITPRIRAIIYHNLLLFGVMWEEKVSIIFAPGQVSTIFVSISAAKIKEPPMFWKPKASYLRVDHRINNTKHQPPRSPVSFYLAQWLTFGNAPLSPRDIIFSYKL